MKTSWLNGSKRILSALLIAAALMFGWTPLGEGKALAATDKGQQFAHGDAVCEDGYGLCAGYVRCRWNGQ